jgi:hypothetical protein
MDFSDLLKCGPMANMVATALDGWTVRDPFTPVLIENEDKANYSFDSKISVGACLAHSTLH